MPEAPPVVPPPPPVVPRRPALLLPVVAELQERCVFPPPGSAVVAAVSGGADSLALLGLACAAGLKVTAMHVDHGLRAGSAAEADVVAGAAARLGADFERRRVVVEPGPDLEARARQARYGVLPAGVLTGHTADDLAETVLLNVCWGAGLDGLAPMRPPLPMRSPAPGPGGDRGPPGASGRPARDVRRPLLALRRADTVRLCRALGLEPVVDPSNDDLRFRRNQVRHRLLPLLAEIAARDPVPVLARQAGLLGEDAALLDELAAVLDPTDAAGLTAAPLPLARRAVRAWLRAGGDAEVHPPSAAEVARVLDVAAGRVAACQVGGGRRVVRSAGRLTVSCPASETGEGAE